jgi:PAS domain S-box-containing protein
VKKKTILKAEADKTNKPKKAVEEECSHHYKQLVENSPNSVFIVSGERKVIYINKAFKKLFGLDEKIIGKPFEKLLSSDESLETARELIQKTICCKSFKEVELEFKGKGKKGFYSTSRVYPIYNSRKKRYECAFIVIDITKAKLEELERIESEKKYRALFDLSPSPIIIVDLQTRQIIDWNLAAMNLLGYSASEMKKCKLGSLLEKKIADKTRVDMEMQLIRKGRFALETVWVEKTGREIPVNLYGGYLELKKKNLVQIYAYDISESKKAEKALLENLEIRTALFEGSRDPMLITDLNGLCRFANPAMTRVFGYSLEDVIGKMFPGIIENKENIFTDWVQSCRKGIGVSNYETQRKAKSGQIIPVSITISPIKNAKGELIYLSFYYRDISESKKAKEELMVANESIKKYAEELKESNANKDKFFSIIAHDLRSPFQGLLGFCNLLDTEYDNLNIEENKFIIHNIGESAKNIFALIENLLEWTRVQSGRKEFIPKKLCLYEEALTAIISQKIQAINKNIVLKNLVDENIYVKADENMLQTVLRNLISNGTKFTNSGGSVTVSAVPLKDFVEICIEDTGMGIAEDDIPRMFRIETHFVMQGTAKEPGTGLGLILCREFIQKHGGDLRVESVLGKGSRFYFTIPRVDV